MDKKIVNLYKDFKQKIKLHPGSPGYVIQEYVLGVPMYAHYFHSPLTGETELMGFDKTQVLNNNLFLMVFYNLVQIP